MPSREVQAPPASEWTEAELTERLWKTGNLRYLCYSRSQAEIYDEFHAWNQLRRDAAIQQTWQDAGALYRRQQVWEIARRWGKSALTMILAVEALIRRPASQGMFFTKTYASILDIYVPLVRVLFSDAPEGYKPQFVTASAGQQCGFKIPAVDGFIHMVGVDREPEVNRGQGMDFVIGTECAFVKGLEDLMVSIIHPMFQGRPWGWIILESSTAVEPDCDFNKHFREDAKKRSAYHCRTIRDNDALSEREIEEAIAECGGIQSPKCQRELFCIEARDDAKMVVPEFNEDLHCVEPSLCTRPPQAFAYVGMDPGYADMCGIVWFYVDWQANKIVVEEAYAQRNRSTSEIAKVIKATEQRLWGSSHRQSMLPQPRMSLMDALKPTPTIDVVEETQTLLAIGGTPETVGDRIVEAPSGALTWWQDSSQSHRPNPFKRVSDVDPQQLADLRTDHGLVFEQAKKGPGSKDAHLQHLRMLFTQNKIVILKNGRTHALIEQLRSMVWNDKGTDWKSTPTLGHGDALAAFMYACREIDLRRNPFKHGTDPRAFDVVIQDDLYRDRLKAIYRRHRPSGSDTNKFTRDRVHHRHASKPKRWR